MTQQYLALLDHILTHGKQRTDRTGVGNIGVFGYMDRYDLGEGFPLLTTKKMFTRGIFTELLWFIDGETNIKPLVDANVHIWDGDAYKKYCRSPEFGGETQDAYIERVRTDPAFAATHGELGPVYGKQWRDFNGVDQLRQLVDGIRKDPPGRRHILSAWNPSDLPAMALPPCHVLMQFHAQDGKLDCQLFQRSADAILGVPFNIASYAALTTMVAHVTGHVPGEFIHTYGDLHIYNNHLAQAREQLTRAPRPLPTLRLARDVAELDDFRLDDLIIEGYDPHPPIKAQLNT